MIKFISLKNFQSHKNSTLEFCPYVNSIVAPSDSGKTAILRALNWTINNNPSGDAFVSQWALDEKGNQKEETVVTVNVDSDVISRTKKGKINTYTINNKILEAIGVGVPQEIQEAFNFSEVNIQKQMDAPFLLSESPSEVARFFNKIINLDLIDDVLSRAENKRRKLNSSIELNEENKKKLEKQIDDYEWLGIAENIFEKIDLLQEKNDDLRAKRESILAELKTYEIFIIKKEEYEKIIDSASPLIEKLDRFIDANKGHEKKKIELKTILMHYEEAHLTIVNLKGIDKAPKIIKQIEELKMEIEDQEEKQGIIKNQLVYISVGIDDIEKYSKIISKLEKQMPNICPLCGGEIK